MKTEIVLTGILKCKNEFLAVKRTLDDDMFPGAWEFPGGHLEEGETLKEGLKRELREEKYITEQFILDKEKVIVLNKMLRENLLTLFACINNREPLVIIGKPGSGKTLSINCIGNSMKGEFSENVFLFQRLEALQQILYLLVPNL